MEARIWLEAILSDLLPPKSFTRDQCLNELADDVVLLLRRGHNLIGKIFVGEFEGTALAAADSMLGEAAR